MIVLSLIYIDAIILFFFLIPGFVSENFQIALIIRGTFWSLQVLFLSFSFLLSFSFYTSVFCVFVRLRGPLCPCLCIYFLFLFLFYH